MYKVLIVDDEIVIRKGLVNFIQWESINCEVVGEAVNGLDAIEKLQALHPEIVITDVKMPGLGGLELTKYIYENSPSAKVIILTGYADFSYAQSALKYGAVGFVLKPTELDQVIEAVEKAKQLISVQRESELIRDEYLADLREKLIHYIVDGVITNSDVVAEKLTEFNILLQNYYVIVYEIENIHVGNASVYNDEQNKFISSIKNFLSIAFKDYPHYVASIKGYRLCSVVSFNTSVTDQCITSLLDICLEILRTVEGFTSFSISIGISGVHYNPVEIAEAYIEAGKALASRFYNIKDSSLTTYSKQINLISSEEKILINSYLELIVKQVQEKQHDSLKTSISELIEKLTLSKQPIDYIKSIGVHLYFSFESLLAGYDLSIGNTYKDILDSNSSVKLTEILIDVAVSVSNQLYSQDKKTNSVIKKVNSYINDNYKSPITLQELADYVHSNGSYLSRLFKNETGSTITDTINKVRLEKAKDLLLNSNLKTYEVAAEVGIPDPSYFSVIFKKYFGISPKEFSHKL